jgi:hypothetical protein
MTRRFAAAAVLTLAFGYVAVVSYVRWCAPPDLGVVLDLAAKKLKHVRLPSGPEPLVHRTSVRDRGYYCSVYDKAGSVRAAGVYRIPSRMEALRELRIFAVQGDVISFFGGALVPER